MKKKIICLVVFVFIFVGTISAKNLGLSLEFGGLYTNHQLHYVNDKENNDGFKHHGIKAKHLGGVNLALAYKLPKNWALFANTMFAFNKTFVNDTQLGFGYVFRPGKGFDIFFGGGLAIGGSIFKWTISNVNYEIKYFNIGIGVSLTASYMFSRKIGIYFGISDNYYKPISCEHRVSTASGDSGSWRKVDTNFMPKYNKSINGRVGLKINF